MTWHPDEWDAFCTLVEEAWPGDFDDATRTSWRVLLDETSPAQTVVALKVLLLEGRTFRPSVSELLATINVDVSTPTSVEAIHMIYGPGGVTHRGCTTGTHPLVEGFVERHGLEFLQALPVDCPVWGAKHRRDLAAEWDAFVRAWQARGRMARAAGHGDPRRLDPVTQVLALGTRT
jgi:hypothetical protein